MALLEPLAYRVTRPVVAEAKIQVRRLLIAIALCATGVACAVGGLAYAASSLWHALAPLIGTVWSDLLLGGLYAGLAAILLGLGFKAVR
jgi:hypothetical protein